MDLPLEPPRAVAKALRRRFSAQELEVLSALFAVRATGQQVANTISNWMADSAGSPARFQILVRLWAEEGAAVAHKDIVAGMGVTRATVSGLMSGLERDGLVVSAADEDDRRSMLARLTARGEAAVEKAIAANKLRLRATYGALSAEERTTLVAMLKRLREAYQLGDASANKRSGSPSKKERKDRSPRV